MENSLVQVCLEELKEGKKGAGKVLLRLYLSLFTQAKYTPQRLVSLNTLIKIYGKYEVFYALLELYNYSKRREIVLDHDNKNIHPLLRTFLKTRLERKLKKEEDNRETLVTYIENFERLQKKKKKNISDGFEKELEI